MRKAGSVGINLSRPNRYQPRSGERMQPRARALGPSRSGPSPRGAEETHYKLASESLLKLTEIPRRVHTGTDEKIASRYIVRRAQWRARDFAAIGRFGLQSHRQR